MQLINWSVWTGLLAVVSALDCQGDSILKKYALGNLRILQDMENNTPPSVTRDTWYINICGDNDNKDKDKSLPEQCDKDDVVCGVESVKIGKGDSLITRIVDFKSNLKTTVNENTDENANQNDNLTITIQDNKWGSYYLNAILELQCDANLINDKIEKSTWNESTISMLIKGPSGCLKDEQDNGDNNHNDKNGDKKEPNKDKPQYSSNGKNFSWFTWIVIYTILSTIIYLLIISYMNTRGGDLNDFRIEFVQRSKELIFSLPRFSKEVIGKIFNSNGVSQRDGYSAL